MMVDEPHGLPGVDFHHAANAAVLKQHGVDADGAKIAFPVKPRRHSLHFVQITRLVQAFHKHRPRRLNGGKSKTGVHHFLHGNNRHFASWADFQLAGKIQCLVQQWFQQESSLFAIFFLLSNMPGDSFQ